MERPGCHRAGVAPQIADCYITGSECTDSNGSLVLEVFEGIPLLKLAADQERILPRYRITNSYGWVLGVNFSHCKLCLTKDTCDYVRSILKAVGRRQPRAVRPPRGMRRKSLFSSHAARLPANVPISLATISGPSNRTQRARDAREPRKCLSPASHCSHPVERHLQHRISATQTQSMVSHTQNAGRLIPRAMALFGPAARLASSQQSFPLRTARSRKRRQRRHEL